MTQKKQKIEKKKQDQKRLRVPTADLEKRQTQKNLKLMGAKPNCGLKFQEHKCYS